FHHAHFHHGHFHHGGAFGSLGLGFGFWPGYYYPYYDSYYYPWYYDNSYVYDPSVYYPSAVHAAPSLYYYPPGNGLYGGSSTLTTPGRSVMPRATGPEETIPAPQPGPQDGTYQYDGGPTNTVPMPQAEPAPGRKAAPTLTPDGRVVSIESKAPKYS